MIANSTETTSSTDRRMASMVSGAGWMILYKVLERGIALASVMVLARLLVPSDFGVMALAMSVLALLEILGSFGFDTALIQRQDAARAHFDAVWTFNVALGLAMALAMAALAWPLAALYGDPRLVGVMLVLAGARAIQGFENVGIVRFRKDLQFDREFRFLLARRLATSVLVTIPLAFVFRSYWALLAGNFGGTCIAVLLSYAMHPYRPRVATAGIRELLQFSKWLFMTAVVEALHQRMADLIVGRFAGTAALGSLAMAREIARIPREMVAPVHRAVFPGYVSLAGDIALLRHSYLRVTSVLMLLALPAAAGLCLLAGRVVPLLLGTQWLAAVPLVQLLALNGVLLVLLSTAHNVILAVGNARSASLVLAFDLLLALPLMLWLVPAWGAPGAAVALLAGSVCSLPLYLKTLRRTIGLRSRELAAMLVRPACATAIMAGFVAWLQWGRPPPSGAGAQIVELALIAASAAVAYFTLLYVLWRKRHEHHSAEAWLFGRFEALLSALHAQLRLQFRGH
ncbi:MAG: oligosaccharide flippase family protein [Betaproteobacteria bacterium]